MLNKELVILFLGSIPIGIWAVIFGASSFLAIPFLQLLYPQAGLAALTSNMKVGSFLRNAVAVWAGREQLNVKAIKKIIVPLAIGAVLGSASIVSLSQKFVFPILILSIVSIEFSDRLQRYMKGSVFMITALLTGVYIGIFGAGSSILIWALLRYQIKGDSHLANVRIDGLFAEGFVALLSVMVFFIYGRVNFPIALAWTAGSMIGGYLGGKIVKISGKWSAKSQRLLLRISFVVALVVAVLKFI